MLVVLLRLPHEIQAKIRPAICLIPRKKTRNNKRCY